MCKLTPVGEQHGSTQGLLRLSISFWLLLTLFCLITVSGQAQVLYGSLTGNVTDGSGAAIVGAKVSALNVATGVARETTTNSNGAYTLPSIQPGAYKVTISAKSFASSVVGNVEVVVNNVKRVDAALKVASESQEVTVTAESAMLQTEKADVHTDLSANQITNLPVMASQGRNFQSLLRVVPGFGQLQEDNSQAGNPQRAMNTNVNGQSRQGIATRIDGALDAYPWLPANVAYVPPADAIETVNVVTNSFDPEQGMAGAASVNVQIKSGTNKFHGTAHEFHTDNNLKAKQYFNDCIGTSPCAAKKPLIRNNQNQFGGTFGGPIIKNKLFFFGDFERTTTRGPAGPTYYTLPTDAMRAGDFRGLVDKNGNQVKIYDPNTVDVNGNKQQISCNGVLNVICSNRIDPASSKLVGMMPKAPTSSTDLSAITNDYVTSGGAGFNRNNWDVKVNYIPGDKSTLFARYSRSTTSITDSPGLGAAVGDAVGGGQLGSADSNIQSAGLGATHAFSSNVLIDWNFGFTRQHLGAVFGLDSADGLKTLGIKGTNNDGIAGNSSMYNGLPAFQISVPNGIKTTLNLGNPNTGNPFLFRDNQFVTGTNLSWTKGKHGLRFGMEWDHTQLNHFQPQGGSFQTARGSFKFNGNATSLPGGAQTFGNAFADFLLGLSNETGKAVQNSNPNALRWSVWSWYARDQWQVSPRLTVTLGVRWEYYPFGYSDNGNGLRVLNPDNGMVYIGGNGQIPLNSGVNVGPGQFLPRLGLAYRLGDKTVVRAGYGWSADPNNYRYMRNAFPATTVTDNTSSSPYVPVASLTGTNATGPLAGIQTGILLPTLPDLSSGVAALPTNVNDTTIANPFHRGYIQSFNLMVQHEFAGFIAETGYVGARAIHPLTNMNVNAGYFCPVPNPNNVPCGNGARLMSTLLGKTYSGDINAETPFKDNSYDSLQSKLTKKLKGGSMIGAAWTWSRAINYSDNEELNYLLFAYPAYWDKNRGPASFDRTHNLQIYAVYDLPFGKGQKWATSGIGNALAGGWQFNTVISRLSGTPFTVTANGSELNAPGNTQTADLVGTYSVLGGIQHPGCKDCYYFNPNIFSELNCVGPDSKTCYAGRFGNTGRDSFRGPGFFNMDVSLFRNFKITERTTLQFRAEAFSITNTPHFANPNTSCASGVNFDQTTHQGTAVTCGTGAGAGNFGKITSTMSSNPGNRSLWLGAKLMF
jgi:hypothetical protein